MTDLLTADLFNLDALAALAQVIMIDLVLAGDNAIVIGLAAAGLPPESRAKAILVGIVAATVLRILFAFVAVELLQTVIGVTFAGGLLLLWVVWKMHREIGDAHANPRKSKTHGARATFAVVRVRRDHVGFGHAVALENREAGALPPDGMSLGKQRR